TARNSRPLEVIGTYDPIPKKDTYDSSGKLHKDIKLDTLRAKYWIGVGAQPTDVVWRLLSMVCSSLYPLLPHLNRCLFGDKADREKRAGRDP
ncbi:hypothetical protein GE09DRAFT_1109481, partial [Coniochaeta sp. 2T2.1]